jgi:hypothetical protein
VDRTTGAFRNGWVLVRDGARELDGECRVVADAAMECKCGPLFGSGRRDLEAMYAIGEICIIGGVRS